MGEQLETMLLVEQELLVKVILVDQLMPLLEKVVVAVVELELLVVLVETLQELLEEQEVLHLLYHVLH